MTQSSMRDLAKSAALLPLAVLFALVLAEVGIRLAPADSRIAREAAPRRASVFGHLLQRDPDPDILFRLKEHLDTTFLGEVVTTGENGFRGAVEQADERVVVIGDSVAFGWGVADAETFSGVLETLLGTGSRSIDVTNMGVPGYNTVQEVALLERHLVLLQPQTVVVVFNGNDLQKSADFRKQPVLSKRSYLYRLIALRVEGMRIQRATGSGHKAVLDALQHLGQLSRAHGFRVIFFAYGSFVHPGPKQDDKDREFISGKPLAYVAGATPHARILRVCQEEGFQVATLDEVLRGAREVGLVDEFSDIWLRAEPPVDPHPSRLGHRLIAERLAELIAPGLQPSQGPANPVASPRENNN